MMLSKVQPVFLAIAAATGTHGLRLHGTGTQGEEKRAGETKIGPHLKLKELNAKTKLQKLRAKSNEIFDLADQDGDGFLDFKEFQALLLLTNPEKTMTDEIWSGFCEDCGGNVVGRKVGKDDFWRAHEEKGLDVIEKNHATVVNALKTPNATTPRTFLERADKIVSAEERQYLTVDDLDGSGRWGSGRWFLALHDEKEGEEDDENMQDVGQVMRSKNVLLYRECGRGEVEHIPTDVRLKRLQGQGLQSMKVSPEQISSLQSRNQQKAEGRVFIEDKDTKKWWTVELGKNMRTVRDVQQSKNVWLYRAPSEPGKAKHSELKAGHLSALTPLEDLLDVPIFSAPIPEEVGESAEEPKGEESPEELGR